MKTAFNYVKRSDLIIRSRSVMRSKICVISDQAKVLLINIWVPVKCETKQNRNGTKRNRSKRNETNRNETKQIETNRNETNRNETKQIETKRNKTKWNKSKQMIWQATVDKNQYFLILEFHFLILEIHFLIYETEFLILKMHTIF